MSKKKSKSETGPSKAALPYVTAATNAATDAYQGNQQNLTNIGNELNDQFETYANRDTAGLDAAKAYNTDVLGGKFLGQGNPYTQGIIDTTNDSITDRINSIFGAAGRTGSGRNVGVLSKSLADSENGLRYTDYNNERGRMDAAVGGATALNGAENNNIATLLALAQGAAETPYLGSKFLTGSTQSLWGNAQKSTQQNSTLDNILNTVGAITSGVKAYGGG